MRIQILTTTFRSENICEIQTRFGCEWREGRDIKRLGRIKEVKKGQELWILQIYNLLKKKKLKEENWASMVARRRRRYSEDWIFMQLWLLIVYI